MSSDETVTSAAAIEDFFHGQCWHKDFTPASKYFHASLYSNTIA
ncbi:hypothetical protein [Bradyrhizobium sp. Rc2d]|nr:hypothetical protein [Bradyrhizobium sp. Rc2d]